jgi:hypothetical protein
MDKAVHALWERGIYTYLEWGGYTDWNVEVCSGCGDINIESLRFAYTDRQAAEIMLGYVNDLREEVYGTTKYNLVIDETLIELAKIRAKELSKNYAHGGTFTNASENIYEDISNPYFSDNAKKILSGVLFWGAKKGYDFLPIIQTLMRTNLDELLTAIITEAEQDPQMGVVLDKLKGFVGKGDNESVGDIEVTMKTALECFSLSLSSTTPIM